jgi:hypothetical protein
MKKLESIFGKNWRTSILGYGGAIFTACMPLLQTGAFDPKKDWPYLVGAAGAAIFGRIAKDAAVTGLPTITDELKAANEALAIAKLTKNENAIKLAQAVVDGLQKQVVTQPATT